MVGILGAKELGKDTAKKIADSIMQMVPFNINIMDTRGYIIASGDKARLNTLHLGAVHALKSMEPVVVYEDTETERKGVNFPIVFSNQLMGVIGVSGDPKEVTHIGNIVVAMACMMIETQMINDMASIREGRLKDFLNDWVYLKKEGYREDFISRARDFGVDISIPRVAAVITSRRARFSVFDQIKRWLEQGEFVVRQGSEDALLILNHSPNLMQRVDRIMSLNKDLLGCFLGDVAEIINDSVIQALQTLQTARMLEYKQKVVQFSEIALEHGLGHLQRTNTVKLLMEKLSRSEYQKELVETIIAFTRGSNDQNELCKQLHIHRNTLNYRLARIEELTGKNPRIMRDLMELYTAVIHNKWTESKPDANTLFSSFFQRG